MLKLNFKTNFPISLFMNAFLWSKHLLYNPLIYIHFHSKSFLFLILKSTTATMVNGKVKFLCEYYSFSCWHCICLYASGSVVEFFLSIDVEN